MTLAIIIPAHNEESVIKKTATDLEQTLKIKHKVLIVDDHSTDGTVAEVEKLTSVYPNIQLIRNEGKPGFASAVKVGFENAESNLVVQMNADLCDAPQTVEAMFAKMAEGFDVVCGSRYMKGGKRIGGPFIQGLLSRLAGISTHLFTGIPTYDISNSFKMYKKEVLRNVNLNSKSFEISMEIALKAYYMGYKIAEVPTIWNGRTAGNSKFYLSKVFPHYFPLYFRAIFRRSKMRTSGKKISQGNLPKE